ncbi:MAG: sulfatase-like hydrolase/transferase [Lentisphaerales bacterium]|nr:sulfatase-like hydrolase/transferase [Lentisphaerales bacterium]
MKSKLFQMLLALMAFTGVSLTAADAPNFVVFYVDDLGWADTSVRMMQDIEDSASDFHQTPSLERLAKKGMVFSNGYSPAPTCTPSRISIHYGKTNARLGYTTVHDIAAHNAGLKESIPKDNISIPQMLKQANLGYVTAHFGKGIAIAKPKEIGYDIDDCYDVADNGNYHGDYVKIAPESEREKLPDDNPKRIYSLTETCENFIQKQSKTDKPFFMMVSHYAAHVPHMASPHMIEKYRNLPRGKHCKDIDYIDPGKMSKGYREVAWRLQYAAMIEEMDMSLGRIMDALEKAGIADNTYIVFTSDNGGGLTPNGVLTGGKANLYEGGLRVPTIVSGPGMLKGAQCDVPVIQWDLLPTFHDLSGSKVSLPEGVDGGSLKSVFEKGNSGSVDRPIEGLVFNYPYYAAAPINAIRMGDYKYMRHLNTGETRLYNVVKDISEKKDLSQSMPEKVAQLADAMDSYLKKVNARQIDEVYKARFAELDYFKEQAIENSKRDLERKLKKAPTSEHAKIKAAEKNKIDQRLANYDKQIEHCRMQTKNENFIGGNYKKK